MSDTTREWNQTACCRECGIRLALSARGDKLFCGATCRKRYNRGKREAERQLKELHSGMVRLENTLRDVSHSRTTDAHQALSQLRRELAELEVYFEMVQ